jgi:hypothetical protein
MSSRRPASPCADAPRRVRDATLDQVVDGQLHLATAADHADVRGVALGHGTQHLLVVLVSAGDDHDVRPLVDRRLGDSFGNVARVGGNAVGCVLAKQVGAIIEKRHVELERHAEPRHRLADVARAGDVQPIARRQLEGVFVSVGVHRQSGRPPLLDVVGDPPELGRLGHRRHGEVDRAAADEAVVPPVVVIELEGEATGLAGGHHGHRPLPDLGRWPRRRRA